MNRTLTAAILVSLLSLSGLGLAVRSWSSAPAPRQNAAAGRDLVAVDLARAVQAPAGARPLSGTPCTIEDAVECWTVTAAFGDVKAELVASLERTTGTTPAVDCPTPPVVVGAGFCRLSAASGGHRVGVVVSSMVAGRYPVARPTGTQLVVVTAG